MNDCDLLQRLAKVPELLARIPNGGKLDLRVQTRLREEFEPDLVRAAFSLTELRHRARDRYSHAADMWFDRAELEQGTPDLIARHKGQRFAQHGNEPVLDLYCGFGANAIGLALNGVTVTAVDRSPISGLRTEWNSALYGVADRIRFEQADNPLDLADGRIVHLQPQRPDDRMRSLRLEDLQPTLEQMQALAEQTPGSGLTLSPASNFGGKFSDSEIELISLHGDCKEAVIWSGSLKTDVAMRATLLPTGWTLAGNPWESFSQVGPLNRYLYDPDPAIVRAGLVDLLAETLQLFRLDGAEEYLTGGEVLSCPAVTGYEVVADLPNNDREIRQFFRQADYGELEIRCRHVPVDATALHKKLPLNGARKGTLFFARLDGKTRALVAHRLPDSN